MSELTVAVAAGVALVLLMQLNDGRRTRRRIDRLMEGRGGGTVPAGLSATAASSRQLVPPPMVISTTGDPVPLADWLQHEHPTIDRIWPLVVEEFYSRAAGDPRIAAYFVGVDMVQLQRHFLAALLIVAKHGLSETVFARMRQKHLDVRDAAGRPITVEVYDQVVHVLLDVLSDKRVPDGTLWQLGSVMTTLRPAIVPPQP